MTELWRDVPGFEGRYAVSDKGRVWSAFRGGRYLRPGRMSGGHLSVSLGRKNSRCVHELVLTAFVGPSGKGCVARHLNGDHLDNRWPENLEWSTYRRNAQDKKWHNGQKTYKLSGEQASLLKQPILGDASTKDLVSRFNIARSTVYAVKTGLFHVDA